MRDSSKTQNKGYQWSQVTHLACPRQWHRGDSIGGHGDDELGVVQAQAHGSGKLAPGGLIGLLHFVQVVGQQQEAHFDLHVKVVGGALDDLVADVPACAKEI